MPEGPFGFPRFTSIGPLVEDESNISIEEEDDSDEFIGRDEVNFERREWTREAPDDVPPHCRPYFNIDEPVEFIVPISDATPASYVYFPTTDRELFRSVANISEQYDDAFIGIHETTKEKVSGIMTEGFSEERQGELSVSNDIDIRQNAVFTWQYMWDISINNDDLAGIITVAPRESVIASDMSSSVTVPADVYVRDFTMKYIQYIHCLREYGAVAPTRFEEDLIQELPMDLRSK